MRQGVGDVLREALQKCRNCGRVGAVWDAPPWRASFNMVVHGVCSQRCNDRMAARFHLGFKGLT